MLSPDAPAYYKERGGVLVELMLVGLPSTKFVHLCSTTDEFSTGNAFAYQSLRNQQQRELAAGQGLRSPEDLLLVQGDVHHVDMTAFSGELQSGCRVRGRDHRAFSYAALVVPVRFLKCGALLSAADAVSLSLRSVHGAHLSSHSCRPTKFLICIGSCYVGMRSSDNVFSR
jgi:hypothetical protein